MENLFGEKIEKEVWEEPLVADYNRASVWDNLDTASVRNKFAGSAGPELNYVEMRILAYAIRNHISKYMGPIPHTVSNSVFDDSHYIMMQIEGVSVCGVGIWKEMVIVESGEITNSVIRVTNVLLLELKQNIKGMKLSNIFSEIDGHLDVVKEKLK